MRYSSNKGKFGLINLNLLDCFNVMVGGSLIVQMFGSSPTKKPKEADEGNQKSNLLLVQHEQLIKNGLSASPIVVRSTKDVVDISK